MGVQNLWKALEKGGAVEKLEGSQAGQHERIVDAVEGKVVAVDLSAWLMQAQSAPALLEHFDSPYARAVKVVFDRTIHWLRYGCLPVFVIEGRTPAAKLDKLRARCVAQYGPSSYLYNVGNREGGQFDRLGQAVKRLLNALGVPCVQAVGEAEAMCAALNVCGWAHAVHTADVDALLFGALTVYRGMHLQTDDPRRSTLTRCCMYDVRRVLGLSRGGDAALMAVAHLAGGDYDAGGADNVGETLALGAVRQLLLGCEDDDLVLQRLEAAIARGPDPELDALTKCTGCKACGHEGNRKGRINTHSAKNGCAACACEDGCLPREFTECECAFHARADERLLNRVVRRASATPNFMASFRTAAATYAEQTRSAIASIQREYGLPVPGSSRNVFSWSGRPDVRAVSDIMCGYIKEWDYRQVRLKLLPLLLEWDVRQGPSLGPSLRPQVQFRPSSIRKVSSKGADAAELTGVPLRQQKGWRYVLLVDRLPAVPQPPSGAGADAAAAAGDVGVGGTSAAAAAAAVDTQAEEQEEEDLAIDQSWIAGTARSRPPKQRDPIPAAAAAAAGGGGGGAGSSQYQPAPGVDTIDLLGGDDTYEAEPFLATQMPTQAGLGIGSPLASRPASSSRSPMPAAARVGGSSQAGGSQGGGGSGGGAAGSLQFAEHRSVRCSLIDAVWPHLTAAFRQPAASGGRARSAGASRKKQPAAASGGAAAAAAAAAGLGEDKQRTVKDFFGVVKDYTAPGRQPSKVPAAAEGGAIPGLAGLAGGGRGMAGVAAAAAVTPAAAGQEVDAAPAAGQQSFMEWLHLQDQGQAGQQQQQQQPSSLLQQPTQSAQQQPQQHESQQQQQQQQQQLQSQLQQQGPSGKGARSAGQAGGGRAGSGSGRGRRRQAAAKTPVKAGPLDRFLQRPAGAAAAAAAGAAEAGDSQQATQAALECEQPLDLQMCDDVQQQPEQGVQAARQPFPKAAPAAVEDSSPEVPSLAARLAAKAAAAGAAMYRSSPRSRQRPGCGSDAEAAEGEAAAAAGEGRAPPAKKVSTPLAKELLSSPAKVTGGSSGSGSGEQQGGCVGPCGGRPAGRYNPQYEALLQQLGVASPEQPPPQEQQQQQGGRRSRRAVKGLFNTQPQQQLGAGGARPSALVAPAAPPEPQCIELLDSPMPLAPEAVAAAAAAGSARTNAAGAAGGDVEVVDLT